MATPDEAHIELKQTLAALRRELEARTAECHEALARQRATSEILCAIAALSGRPQARVRSHRRARPTYATAEFSAVSRLEEGLLHLIGYVQACALVGSVYLRCTTGLRLLRFQEARALLEQRGVPDGCRDVAT